MLCRLPNDCIEPAATPDTWSLRRAFIHASLARCRLPSNVVLSRACCAATQLLLHAVTTCAVIGTSSPSAAEDGGLTAAPRDDAISCSVTISHLQGLVWLSIRARARVHPSAEEQRGRCYLVSLTCYPCAALCDYKAYVQWVTPTFR